ncbi:NAD(P)H-dependent oxidoreductase subunit E, partial [bacterium]|nr:NAD(P)H-dependent oxidoreductase subunit E [bacterium]
MEKVSLKTDINEEQKKAQQYVEAQGLRVLVCSGTGCMANGSLQVIEKFKELGANVSTLTKHDKMTVVPTGCHGFCEQGVLVVIPDLHTTYVKVKLEDVEEIFNEHLINGRPVERLLYTDPATNTKVAKTEEINFYAKQTRTALANCGKINAESLEEAISVGTYSALAKVIEENDPDSVITTIEESGLRGRGGGGFATGRKWRSVSRHKGGKSYVICNGDEGDPGAFMDRSVMEGDPHRLLEGMAIAGFAVGADEAYIYVRAE